MLSMVSKMFCILLGKTLRKCFHLSFIYTLFFSIYCILTVFGKRASLKRFVVEDGAKPAIFGSYSYDPVKQVFVPPPPNSGNESNEGDKVGTKRTPQPSDHNGHTTQTNIASHISEDPHHGDNAITSTPTSKDTTDMTHKQVDADTTNHTTDYESTLGVTEDKTFRKGKTINRENTKLWWKKPTPSKVPYRMQII